MSDEILRHVRAVLGGGPPSVRAAARLMTLLADAPERLPDLLEAYGRAAPDGAATGIPFPRLLIGITGAPGCGKSTLTDALVTEFRRRHPDRRVGVVAVDPSSPFTGGAVLGDRVRMMRHATDPMVFVRSLATRGHLGGLTLGVKGVVRVMALLGCDIVFIETVGVGQSEVEVASVADLVVIVLAPGQGDSVQLLKAGLLEVGDLLVVNKADRPEAARLHSQVLAMLHLAQGTGREARAYLVSAEEGTGIGDLASDLEAAGAIEHAEWVARRLNALREEIRESVLHEAQQRIEGAFAEDGQIAPALDQVLRGEASVATIADRLLEAACRRRSDP